MKGKCEIYFMQQSQSWNRNGMTGSEQAGGEEECFVFTRRASVAGSPVVLSGFSVKFLFKQESEFLNWQQTGYKGMWLSFSCSSIPSHCEDHKLDFTILSTAFQAHTSAGLRTVSSLLGPHEIQFIFPPNSILFIFSNSVGVFLGFIFKIYLGHFLFSPCWFWTTKGLCTYLPVSNPHCVDRI